MCQLLCCVTGVGEFISWIPRYMQSTVFAPKTEEEKKDRFVVELPTFLGQLIGGIILVNLPGHLLDDIDPTVSAYCREICLSIILIRAGLGLELGILWTVGGTTLSLACIPCIVEAVVAAVCCKLFRPSIPWGFCFALGFVQVCHPHHTTLMLVYLHNITLYRHIS